MATQTLEKELTTPATQTIELGALADTYVRADLDVRKNDNYGHERCIMVGTGRGSSVGPAGTADAMRGLVLFDLSGVPPTIDQAVLQLTILLYGGSTDSPYTVGVYGNTEPWEEGNGAESYPQVVPGTTGVDAASGVAWEPTKASNTRQPAFDPTPVAETKIDPKVSKVGTVVSWDITALVRGWVQGTRKNYGIMLRDVTTGKVFRELAFGAHECDLFKFPDGVRGPRLVIQAEKPTKRVPKFPIDAVRDDQITSGCYMHTQVDLNQNGTLSGSTHTWTTNNFQGVHAVSNVALFDQNNAILWTSGDCTCGVAGKMDPSGPSNRTVAFSAAVPKAVLDNIRGIAIVHRDNPHSLFLDWLKANSEPVKNLVIVVTTVIELL